MSSFAKLGIFLFPFENSVFEFFMQILHIFQTIFSFLFGDERCLCCGDSCLVMPLCRTCANKFLYSSSILKTRCRICGKPLVSEIELCSTCRNSPNLKSVDKVFPLQTYRIWKKNLLFIWKMAGKRTLSPFFAFAVESKIKQIETLLNQSEKLSVVPVPPRPKKIKKIGWDQIDELCFYLKYGFNRKIFPILERHTKIQQKKLSREERLDSIGKSYFLIEENKQKKLCKNLFDGNVPESVILLDDLMTTGSTFEDCSKMLKDLGVKYVYCVSLMIVD